MKLSDEIYEDTNLGNTREKNRKKLWTWHYNRVWQSKFWESSPSSCPITEELINWKQVLRLKDLGLQVDGRMTMDLQSDAPIKKEMGY